MSPKDSARPTIAGTKQRPTNSLIVNVSLSPPIIAAPATNWNVKSGENIAYTQSLIALTRSIAARASTRSQNTANMIVLMIEVCTICSTALATSRVVESLLISLNLKIEYPYTTRGPYIPPDLARKSFGLIQKSGASLQLIGAGFFIQALLTSISVGIDGVVNHFEFDLSAIVSAGIVMTDAVTTLDRDIVHWTNHQVNGTIRIPRASFGSITLYENDSFPNIVPSAMRIRRIA
jgi:hypothetical protein